MKRLIFVCGLLFLNSCSRHDSAGNTVETENSVAITVVDPNGNPAPNVITEIRPKWFVSDTLHATDTSLEIRNIRTDAKGKISCKGLPFGRYMVKAYGDSLGAISEINHIDPNLGKTKTRLSLAPFGKMKGSITLPKGAHHAWVQVYGTESKAKTDSLGHFEMEGLASGIIRIRAITYEAASTLAETEVRIQSNQEANIGNLESTQEIDEDLTTWRYSKTILLDSLVSDWMQPLVFPTVVTLNLDSNNFDFSEAMTDGRDIRVLDDNGKSLKIERVIWDVSQKKATLRIRLEEISVDSLSTLTLLWGRPGALDLEPEDLWMGIKDSLKLELYSVLVDDFEDQNIQTAYVAPIPSTSWYLVPPEVGLVVDSTLVADLTKAIQPAGVGRTGYAVHISYTQTIVPKYLILGTKLGSGPRSLETLDSIVYWVRGSGGYTIAFDKLTDPGGKAWLHDSLTTSWVRKCVRPQDFMPADSLAGNVGWENVADSLTNLTFFAGEGNDFWIDDIRMFGVNRDQLK